ncbi:MAG: endonuclease III [Candidatus Bathyarchaeota archaeon]|nr:MAG: endonuclease III [Candidatus Bathyarchaeota archaeon]
MNEIISRLDRVYGSNQNYWLDDPFSVLIATILSQNTSDRNSSRAFANLKNSFDITPEVLASAKPADIQPLIMIAGLSVIRSRRIIEVSQEVVTRFKGDLSKVFSLPLTQARQALMNIKGIGPKTADVLLSFVGGFYVMPVDTNIFRVAERLSFGNGRNYEQTRMALERYIPPSKLKDMHFHLIRLGREICKARKPLCHLCPLQNLCPYGVTHLAQED